MAELINPGGNDPKKETPEGEAKIFVDSDWKREAQAEREKLAEQERAAGEKAGAGGDPQMPPADFRALIGALATQAILYLGGFPDPETGQAIFAPDHARHFIDLMGVLEEKVKGNVTEEEMKELQGVAHELRTRYVQIARSVAAKQAGGPGAGGPQGPGPFAGPGAST